MGIHSHSSEERFYILLSRQLAKSISPAEKEELLQILLAYPELRFKAELFQTMWSPGNKQMTEQDPDEAFMRHLLKYRTDFLPSVDNNTNEYPIPSASIWQNKWVLSLSALLFIFFAGLLVNYALKEKITVPSAPAISSVVTKYGDKSRITLPDSSRVWLNAGSRLDYVNTDFTNNRREVYLTGEAYFEIIHNAASPFIVRSGNMQIRVLGTTFNVKAYPEENNMETSLIKGSVEIRINNRPDDIYILKPNEKLVVSTERPERKSESNAYKPALIKESGDIVALKKVDYTEAEKLIMETAWVQNKFVFRAEKFGDLAVKMERWYGIKIRFRNPGKEDLMFTGIFTTETITQALNAMRVVHPFNFSVDKDTIYID